VIYSSDLFTYSAKDFQTLRREKWQSFTNNLRSMLKLVHKVVWQFNNLACSCGLMFDRVISTIAFRSLFSSIRSPKRTEQYWNSYKACFFNQTSTLCKALDRKIPGTSSKHRTT